MLSSCRVFDLVLLERIGEAPPLPNPCPRCEELGRRVELAPILGVDGVEGAKPVDLDEVGEVEDVDGGGVALDEHKKVAPVRVRRG